MVGLVLWSLLLWTTSLGALYGVQVCYGFFMAAEIAYYTYMYAKVEKENYQKVTGHTRASLLSGRFIASVLAQILVSYELMDLRELNYISLGGKRSSAIVSSVDQQNILINSASSFIDRCNLSTIGRHQHLHVEIRHSKVSRLNTPEEVI